MAGTKRVSREEETETKVSVPQFGADGKVIWLDSSINSRNNQVLGMDSKTSRRVKEHVTLSLWEKVVVVIMTALSVTVYMNLT